MGRSALRFDVESHSRLACWGSEYSGLSGGEGDLTVRPTPVLVELSPGVPLEGVRALALGDDHKCALLEGGGVSCWGKNDSGQLGDGTAADRATPAPVELSPGVPLGGVQAITAGGRQSCALVSGGEVYCWGHAYGDFGGDLFGGQTRPKRVELWPGVPLRGARTVSLGENHRCVLSDGGEVYCWGDNDDAALGSEVTGTQDWPRPVTP